MVLFVVVLAFHPNQIERTGRKNEWETPQNPPETNELRLNLVLFVHYKIIYLFVVTIKPRLCLYAATKFTMVHRIFLRNIRRIYHKWFMGKSTLAHRSDWKSLAARNSSWHQKQQQLSLWSTHLKDFIDFNTFFFFVRQRDASKWYLMELLFSCQNHLDIRFDFLRTFHFFSWFSASQSEKK